MNPTHFLIVIKSTLLEAIHPVPAGKAISLEHKQFYWPSVICYCKLLWIQLMSSTFKYVRLQLYLLPQLVQRINSIFSSKRGKKRLKKLSLSNIETSSLRGKLPSHSALTEDRIPQVCVDDLCV